MLNRKRIGDEDLRWKVAGFDVLGLKMNIC